MSAMIYANIFVWTGLLITSLYFVYRVRKQKRSWADVNLWNGILYTITSILFIQLYVRRSLGIGDFPVSEVRLYIFIGGFSMLCSMLATSINHGVIDGILSKIAKR